MACRKTVIGTTINGSNTKLILSLAESTDAMPMQRRGVQMDASEWASRFRILRDNSILKEKEKKERKKKKAPPLIQPPPIKMSQSSHTAAPYFMSVTVIDTDSEQRGVCHNERSLKKIKNG